MTCVCLPSLAVVEISLGALDGTSLKDLGDSFELYGNLRQSCKMFRDVLPPIKQLHRHSYHLFNKLDFRRKSEIMFDRCLRFLYFASRYTKMVDVSFTVKSMKKRLLKEDEEYEETCPPCVTVSILDELSPLSPLSCNSTRVCVDVIGVRFKVVGTPNLVHSLIMLITAIGCMGNSMVALPLCQKLIGYMMDNGQLEHNWGQGFEFIPDWATNESTRWYSLVDVMYQRTRTMFCADDRFTEISVYPGAPDIRFEFDYKDVDTESYSSSHSSNEEIIRQEKLFEEMEIDEILRWVTCKNE